MIVLFVCNYILRPKLIDSHLFFVKRIEHTKKSTITITALVFVVIHQRRTANATLEYLFIPEAKIVLVFEFFLFF